MLGFCCGGGECEPCGSFGDRRRGVEKEDAWAEGTGGEVFVEVSGEGEDVVGEKDAILLGGEGKERFIVHAFDAGFGGGEDVEVGASAVAGGEQMVVERDVREKM